MEEAKELERQKAEVESNGKSANSISGHTTLMPKTPTPRGTPRGILDVLRSIYYETHPVSSTPSLATTPSVRDTAESNKPSAPSDSRERLPLLRKEYDLRSYGMDMIIDFGWFRS